MESTVGILMVLILVVAEVVWAIVGFMFWVPLLARAATIFSTVIVYARVTGQAPEDMRDYLRVATSFWFEGFVAAKEALFPTTRRENAAALDVKIGRLCGEVAWSLLFWLLVAWVWDRSATQEVVSAYVISVLDGLQRVGTFLVGLHPAWQLLVLLAAVVLSFLLGAMATMPEQQSAKERSEPVGSQSQKGTGVISETQQVNARPRAPSARGLDDVKAAEKDRVP